MAVGQMWTNIFVLMVLLTELHGLQLLIISEDLILENCLETGKWREGGMKGEL